MSTTDTPLPADWAIEEALKPFNAGLDPDGAEFSTLGEVKGFQLGCGWAASIIAHARLIEECKPELRPMRAVDAMKEAIHVIWRDYEEGHWAGSYKYAPIMLDKLAEQGFAVVRKESAQ